MRASVLNPNLAQPPIAVQEWPVPEVPRGWVLVQVRCAALNRNDAMAVSDRGLLDRTAVIGSDASGVVAAVSGSVDDVHVGQEVIVLPSLYWGDDERAQSPEYQILGGATQGTHAEYVAVPAENVARKPERLTWAEAAALPLAGITAWRALVTRGGIAPGETVVIAAASSGVSSIAIQIASSLGARVVAISSSEEKLARAHALGAAVGVLRDRDGFDTALLEATGGRAHLALDSTGASWPALVACLRPGGRLVSIGRKAADIATLPVHQVFWKQVSILGSSMGSPADFAELLRHVDDAGWRPVVDCVVPLERISEAYARLDASDRFGKVVVSMC